MTSRDFQAVVSAIDAGTALPPPDIPEMQTVALLGSCVNAQAMAAAFLAGGAGVRLFSTFGVDLSALRANGAITLRGVGPIGSFSVDPASEIHIDLVSGIDEALDGADVIVVVGTVAFQRAMGILMAGRVSADQVVVSCPGRTFGALELAWWLRTGASSGQATVAEMRDLPWKITRTGAASIELEAAPRTTVASIPPQKASHIADALSRLLTPMDYSPTVLHSSLTDASGMSVVPGLIMSGPGLRLEPDVLPVGAEPLDDVTGDAVPEPLANLVAALAAERRAVAQRWGVRGIPADDEWLIDVSHVTKDVDPAATALEHAAGSLVPLASAGRMADIATPVTDALVTSISAMFNFDLSSAGRRLDHLGVGTSNIEDVRRAVGPRPQETIDGR